MSEESIEELRRAVEPCTHSERMILKQPYANIINCSFLIAKSVPSMGTQAIYD